MIHEKADTVKDWETEKDQAQNSFIKSQHSSMRSRAATTKKILGNSDFDLKSTSLKTSDLKSEKGAKDALISPVNAGSKKIALPESNSDNNLRELEIEGLDFEPEPSLIMTRLVVIASLWLRLLPRLQNKSKNPSK